MEGGFMKKLIQGCLLLCTLVFAASQTKAQITITAADVAAQYVAGSTTTWRFDTTQITQVNIGDTGATSWDFSHLLGDSSFTIASVAPATTPFVNDFPGATQAIQSTLSLQVMDGVSATGTAYEFYKLDSYWVDFGIKGTGLVNNAIPGTVVWQKIPADTLLKLPLTMGTQWGSSDSAITLIDVSPFFASRTAKFESSENIVDAYGSMTMPDSTVHQALRIRRTLRISPGTVSYTFLARNGAFVRFTATNPAFPISGVIEVRDISWSGPVVTPTAIGSGSPDVPKEFSLEQNYPNPFNPSTLIQYGLPQGSHVLLDVYNVIGQKVATLVNETRPAGYYTERFDGAGLASGIFFYRMSTSGVTFLKKMLMIK
ncbi:T9SS C-terminal target domain-containing protein [bacterium]|nr:MAG: T9SS C-terminal target domain-containing protein [bacterium]